MHDLEEKVNDWLSGIEIMKKRIKEDDKFPFKTPYTLAKEVGEKMSLNFEIKDRDRAQCFLQYMMYDSNKTDLEDLLGIRVYQINLSPSDKIDNFKRIIHNFCKYCIESGLYDPNEI